MIVSASYRTDIPAFYGGWFARRLAAGFCDVANPYGGRPYRVSLAREDVDGFIFWTKNLQPFLDNLIEVKRRSFPFVVQYTINGYPRALESAVTDAARAVGHMAALARDFGPRAAVWRYDPVIDTDMTPPAWHEKTFARLAAGLQGTTDEVVISFAQIYRKTRRNLTMAGRAHGFSWRDPEPEEKRALAARLADIAAQHGMRLTLCAQPDYAAGAAGEARCVDAARLSDVAGRPIRARSKGNRPGCGCHESRDIGAYDSCPHGCVYCYAVADRDRAKRQFAAHDPGDGFLVAKAGAAHTEILSGRCKKDVV